jgi:hypothetical protein
MNQRFDRNSPLVNEIHNVDKYLCFFAHIFCKWMSPNFHNKSRMAQTHPEDLVDPLAPLP